MEALGFLTYLAIILLIGILCTIISEKIKIPNILLLLLAGLFASNLDVPGLGFREFSPVFLTSMGVLALVMIVFDSVVRFKIKEFDAFSMKALKLTGVFLLLNTIILTISSMLIFQIESVFLALIFSFLMSGTDPAAVMVMFKNAKNRIIELLEIESVLNTPLIVILPFIVIDLISKVGADNITLSHILNQVIIFMPAFFLRLVAGIGSGVFVGLIVFRIMKKAYSETLSPLALITSALLTYVLAENLGGNGVLAITAMGIFIGNVYLKEKSNLFEFSSIFANSLEILVFFLVGLIINIPLSLTFFMKSISLFAIYLVIRYLSIHLSFPRVNYSLKEKIFMTLNVQKGIAVAVVTFTLITLDIGGVDVILNLILVFMLYSIILSTIIRRFADSFLVVKNEDNSGPGRDIRTGV